jgi:hypothetical protein
MGANKSRPAAAPPPAEPVDVNCPSGKNRILAYLGNVNLRVTNRGVLNKEECLIIQRYAYKECAASVRNNKTSVYAQKWIDQCAKLDVTL